MYEPANKHVSLNVKMRLTPLIKRVYPKLFCTIYRYMTSKHQMKNFHFISLNCIFLSGEHSINVSRKIVNIIRFTKV